MRNITLSADERDIDAARERARQQQTTLNDEFRRWLAGYARPVERMERYHEAVAAVQGKLHVGRKLTRDEMNER